MIRRAIWLLIVFFSVIVSTAQDKPEAKDPATRWEKTIRTFEDWDRKNTFPSDAVLFVGSSSIRMWPTRECFEEFAVIYLSYDGHECWRSERIFLTKSSPIKP